MQSVHHYIPNGAGWLLSLHQTWKPGKANPDLRPVLIVPGYGMNSFIFSYHPEGTSLEGWLAEAGFEVWRVDLRSQGGAMSTGGSRDFSLEDLALVDLEVAIRAVAERTRTRSTKVDILGASLGGTLMFVHAALASSPHVGARISMGSPLRWVAIHPAIRLAFSSPTLIGMLPFRGTRTLAKLGLPILARYTPWLLSVYMNPQITDTSAAEEMVKTVEDPNRHINRQIARWIREKDLWVEGVNITEAVNKLETPLLTVVAHSDGVVPAETAAFPHHHITAPKRHLVVVGDDTLAMAHADLFVSREAHERVFRPVSDWLLATQNAPSAAKDSPTSSASTAAEDKSAPESASAPAVSASGSSSPASSTARPDSESEAKAQTPSKSAEVSKAEKKLKSPISVKAGSGTKSSSASRSESKARTGTRSTKDSGSKSSKSTKTASSSKPETSRKTGTRSKTNSAFKSATASKRAPKS